MTLIEYIDKHGTAPLVKKLDVSAAIVRMWRLGKSAPNGTNRRKLMAMGFSLDEIYYLPRNGKRRG